MPAKMKVKRLAGHNKYVCNKCGKECRSRLKLIGHFVGKHIQKSINKTTWRKGNIPWNKGKTYKMGKKKGNRNPKNKWTREMLANDPILKIKRQKSRNYHEGIVLNMLNKLRTEGKRVFSLSQYTKDEKQPDLILFDKGKLVAIEVESEKLYKPSKESVEERYKEIYKQNNFFDDVKTIWFKEVVR